MFVITQDSLRHRRPLARSLTPKAFGFGMTGAEHNVERGTSIAPRTHKKFSESIDTDSADSIILRPHPEKDAQILSHAFH
jgi:hypothetical protein